MTAGDVCARGLGPRGTDPAKPGPPGKVPVWRRRPRAAPWSPGTQRSHGRIRSLRRKRFRRGSLRAAVCVVSEESTRTRARAHTHTHTHTLTHDALARLAPDYNSTGFGDKRWRQRPRMKAFACVRVQTWLLPFAWALEESKRFRWKEISLSMFYATGQTREGPTATHAGSLGPRGGDATGLGKSVRSAPSGGSGAGAGPPGATRSVCCSAAPRLPGGSPAPRLPLLHSSLCLRLVMASSLCASPGPNSLRRTAIVEEWPSLRPHPNR